jgi:hypothetical protein
MLERDIEMVYVGNSQGDLLWNINVDLFAVINLT